MVSVLHRINGVGFITALAAAFTGCSKITTTEGLIMSHPQRKRYFVDKNIQGMLIRQAIKYWIACLGAVAALTTAGLVFISPGIAGLVNSGNTLSTALSMLFIGIVSSLVLLPFVLLQVVRVSNRFVGPVYRLRRSMKELAEGKPVQPVRFRQDDFWQDFADSFNQVAEQMQARSEEVACVPRATEISIETVVEPTVEPLLVAQTADSASAF